jgi:ribosomal protein S18 acetylase RimI-like enzyme
MKVRPMAEVDLEQVLTVFNKGFEDYFIPVAMDKNIFKEYTASNDISVDDSFVIFDGETPAGFAFTGIRDGVGWIGGFAIIPEVRGKGFGKALLKAQLKSFVKLRVKEIYLECIEKNVVAYKMYSDAGFKKIRPIWFLETNEAQKLKNDGVSTEGFEYRYVPMSEVLPYYRKGHIWPKKRETLKRVGGHVGAFALKDGNVESYMVFYPGKEYLYIWDLFPNKAGDALLTWLVEERSPSSSNIANVFDKTLVNLLQKRGYVITQKLWEMRLKLKGFW